MAAQNNSQLNKCFQIIGTGSSFSDNLNNSLFIFMCILRYLPQQKNPTLGCYAGAAPQFLYILTYTWKYFFSTKWERSKEIKRELFK
jgi:hypothetical protein